ncbi:MAG: PP2C family protein-serine/threonine phosphatase [Ghiorsea sp.]|nr:PP2C family protein-serine/threonine phosphatase [Ghiorsea sp.]
MKYDLSPHIKHIDIFQYLKNLWLIPVLIIFAQSVIRITDNPLITHVPAWLFLFNPIIFLTIFTFAAYWAHQPIRTAIKKDTHQSLEQAMANLPMRAVQAFSIAGLSSVVFILSVIFLTSLFNNSDFTTNMFVALILSVSFGLGVLIPTTAVALTMAWMAKTRKKLSLQNLFIGDLEHFQSYPWIMRSGNRPWLIFGTTSLLPVSILALFSWLMLGTNNEVEQHFILMQAIVLFSNLIFGGMALVWITSRTVHRITRELSQGLNFLRQGKFDGHVAVMIDDEMGELARGLNTALAGLKERDSLKDSLAIASDIQKGLMPKYEPNVPNYAIAGFQQSCHAVGGDYYDYITRNDGTTWLVIADVAGKGYPAALTVANLQAMLHALANAEDIKLIAAAKYINKSLHQSLQGGRFVTLFMAELNHQNHQIQWINAGHIPPLLWHQDSITHLEATSPPLGMLDKIALQVQTTTLGIGDTFYACTDGITEARNAAGKMFGDKNVEAWFQLHHQLDPVLLPSSMLACLDKQAFHTRDDDITMLCLNRSN